MQMHSSPGIHAKLLEVYGAARVVDVFGDTGMAQHAKRLGIGGLVVRNAATDEQAADWHQTLENRTPCMTLLYVIETAVSR